VKLSHALACAALIAAAGATRQAAAQPVAGEDLTVHVLTFGPGDHPFFKFGHNAIWIHPRQGEGQVYNFGTFAFDSPTLIPQFLKGRLRYWLSRGPAGETLWSYQAADRTIEAQELDLTAAERLALQTRLDENARPENREYLYDYFWDNCSTRVRDVIDAVVGGRLHAAGARPSVISMRDHALRMTADLPWEYVGLHLGLGSLTDRPGDLWQEAFLPERLRDLLRVTRVARDGGQRPLVKSERVLFTSSRPPPPARPPRTLPWFALVGIAAGALLALLGRLARRRRAARAALGAATGLLGLVLGLLGLALVLLWAFTNHRAAHANANILTLAPWALALCGFSVGVARGRQRATRRAFLVAASAAGAALLGLLLKVLPGVAQDNLAFIALLLPTWGGLTLALRDAAPGAS